MAECAGIREQWLLRLRVIDGKATQKKAEKKFRDMRASNWEETRRPDVI
jgi:hypothetical protein